MLQPDADSRLATTWLRAASRPACVFDIGSCGRRSANNRGRQTQTPARLPGQAFPSHSLRFSIRPVARAVAKPSHASRIDRGREANRKLRFPFVIEIFNFSLNCTPAQFEAAHAILDNAERQRAERFAAFDHCRRFVVRRAMRRIAFAERLQALPSEIHFEEQENEKPIVVGAPKDFHFSASHSSDVGIIGIAASKIGIDIECMDRDIDYLRFAERVFAPDEIEAISSRSGEARSRAFFNCWTGKEAYLKALGLGLPGGLRSFAVRCAPEEPPGLSWTREDREPAQRWLFKRYCNGSYVMTLVTGTCGNEHPLQLQSLSVESIDAGVPIAASTDQAWRECPAILPKKL